MLIVAGGISLVTGYIILCGLLTAIASALHGQNYAPKGYIVVAHTLLAPFVAPLFWAVFRRGRQAKAELATLSGSTNYNAVVEAYYIKPLGKLMARVMQYCTEKPWPLLGGKPTRTQQEICGGFVIGAVCALPSALILWGAL